MDTPAWLTRWQQTADDDLLPPPAPPSDSPSWEWVPFDWDATDSAEETRL